MESSVVPSPQSIAKVSTQVSFELLPTFTVYSGLAIEALSQLLKSLASISKNSRSGFGITVINFATELKQPFSSVTNNVTPNVRSAVEQPKYSKE